MYAAVVVVLFLPTVASGQMRQLQTRHYLIHTDLEVELAEDLGRRMDAMFDEYARRLAGFNPPPMDRCTVYLFSRREDYARFTGQRFPNSGGVFMPSRNLLAAFLEGQGRDGLRRTLQHEAFHQFAHHAIGPNLPIWLNEGLAQVFEEGIWTGRQFLIGQVPPRRLRQLQDDLRAGRLIDFRTMLAMDDRAWRANLTSREMATLQYNQAWAMAHFLIYATDDAGRPRFRHRLLDMLQRVAQGQSADKAFIAAFSDNIPGFQDRFNEWASRLTASREATYIENQSILADLLIMLDGQGRRFTDIAAFRNFVMTGGYRVQYTKGHLQWTTDDPAVYFRDATGRPLGQQQLFFDPRPVAPLPDLVCQVESMLLRTRFFESQGRIDYEVLTEPR